MMNPVLIKIAASTLSLGVACGMLGTVALAAEEDGAAAQDRSLREAGIAAQAAREALGDDRAERAVAQAEEAVGLAPRTAEYRALLGDAYLAAGRFASAETSFLDALALDPSMTSASMSLALAQVALGKTGDALAELADLEGRGDPADIGLAMALAGNTDRGIEMLLAAARTETATARERQNLALALALAGRWAESRLVVSQDVPLGSIAERMTEWARFTQPENSWDQVASLLGVTASADPGQPTALALAPTPADASSMLAAAEPAPADFADAAPPPVIAPMVALTSPAPVNSYIEEQAPVGMFAPVANAPEIAQRLAAVPAVTPAPVERAAVEASEGDASLRFAAVAAATPASVPASQPAPRATVRQASAPAASSDGAFVVQLGAFSQAARVDVAWEGALRRFASLATLAPSSTTFNSGRHSAVLHRLSVGGFVSRAEANRVCTQIRGGGGDCFVRARAGDAPMQMVSRGGGSARRGAR